MIKEIFHKQNPNLILFIIKNYFIKIFANNKTFPRFPIKVYMENNYITGRIQLWDRVIYIIYFG